MAPLTLSPLRAIGLMSGTSMDGIDAAYLETDGQAVSALTPGITIPYAPAFRARLRQFIKSAPELGQHPDQRALEFELTRLHAGAVEALLAQLGNRKVDIVGFHGHTIWHRPAQRATWQMGNGEELAQTLRCPVAYDFRSADVAAGGQGAPLLPVYHGALAETLERPIAVLNVGGVANITWIGKTVGSETPQLLGFDTGPGNGLIDDWVRTKLGLPMDRGGAVAARGRVHEDIVAAMMGHSYFRLPPPKSLDRYDFSTAAIEHLNTEDGAATLTAFTAAAAVLAIGQCPERPQRLLVTGGGRHNATLMNEMRRRLPIPVDSVEAVGWQGDELEAQGFAFLAVRSLYGLPLTFPGTTGVSAPLTGGKIARP